MKRIFILLCTMLAVACGAEPSTQPIPSKESASERALHDAVAEAERAYASYVPPDSEEIRALRASSEQEFAALRASTKAPVKFARRTQSLAIHDPSFVDFIAVNNQVETWWPLGSYDVACYLTWMQGSGGYNGQPTWPNGRPKNSSSWYVERWRNPNVVSAYWQPESGVRITRATCSPLEDWNNLGATYQVPLSQWDVYPSGWGFIQRTIAVDGNGPGPYDDDIALGFDTNSFCYPGLFKGLTHGGTAEYVYGASNPSSPTGYSWRFRHYGGSASYGARTNCVWLGRPVPHLNTYFATTGSPAIMDHAGEAACMITGVFGDLNNGAVLIQQVHSYPSEYRLSVSGGVWGAAATCVPYWDEAVAQ